MQNYVLSILDGHKMDKNDPNNTRDPIYVHSFLRLFQYSKVIGPWLQLVGKYKGSEIVGKHHKILQTKNKLPIIF